MEAQITLTYLLTVTDKDLNMDLSATKEEFKLEVQNYVRDVTEAIADDQGVVVNDIETEYFI
ncbi:MAG: hypothetical protein SPK43_05680 [Candidatus Onthovivens sp.]|nr:hypothetical protein [Candidatus Onthovivens sp.]